MYIGSILREGVSLWTPWVPRQGDYGWFTFELIANTGSQSVQVDIYHKNSEDVGNGALLKANAFAQIGTTGFYWADTASFTPNPGPLKELVRFLVTLTADEPAGDSAAWFRFLPATWFDGARITP